MYVHECAPCVYACGNRRRTCGSWFSPQIYYAGMDHGAIFYVSEAGHQSLEIDTKCMVKQSLYYLFPKSQECQERVWSGVVGVVWYRGVAGSGWAT